MRKLNVIGCGRVGRTFARLFATSGTYELQDVMDVSRAAARACAAFAEAGRAVQRYADLRPAQVWLVTTPDGAIVPTVGELIEAGVISPRNVVAHCSGATPSLDLRGPLGELGHVASFHPVKSFAEPAIAAATFAGTFVALEGDAAALRVLRPALKRIGARPIEIDPTRKLLYHGASVIVCNYLDALLEVGLRCYQAAGMPLETAYAVMQPLVRETVDNVFRVGTARALTGPIARGDHAVVARQHADIAGFDRDAGELYRLLGRVALDLARRQGGIDARAAATIERTLARPVRRVRRATRA